MATTTAPYYWCDSGVLREITVTMNDGSCNQLVIYSDSQCSYRTNRKTITFTLSAAIPIALGVRYQYHYESYENYVLTFSGFLQEIALIPAGATTHTITVNCQEERRCTSGDGDGILRYPALL